MRILGWAAVMPLIIAIALGMWIDGRYLRPFSWTMMLLFIGGVVVWFNVWYWSRISSARHRRRSSNLDRER